MMWHEWKTLAPDWGKEVTVRLFARLCQVTLYDLVALSANRQVRHTLSDFSHAAELRGHIGSLGATERLWGNAL